MIGVIDVGGGNRGIYGSAVFDFCLDHEIEFDRLYGISAGAGNASSYMSRQRGRGYWFYAEYSFRSEYMGLKALAKRGNYLDLEYIYGDLSAEGGENPMRYETFLKSDKYLEIVATDALTGAPHYFRKEDIQKNQYDVLKASSCVPLASKPWVIDGIPYYDGGLSDPIPVKRALDQGCDKVVVILTRPKHAFRSGKNDSRAAKLIEKTYPGAARAIRSRAETYNRQLREALKLEKEGKVLIVAPDNIGRMKTLTKDRDAIVELYHKGLKDAEKILEFI